MGLFKVVPHDESRRIFIRAETIAEAITSAKEKLQLTGEKYQWVLQEDGTEIDNDGVLLEMANNSAITLTLMVLPDAVKYATGLVQPSTSGVTAAVASSPTVQSQPAREDDRNLWDTFSPALLEVAKEKRRATDDQRRDVAKSICNYMFDILGDTSRGTAVVIAKTICSKYPDTFADLIDKINLGAGWESLSAHIYTAINYRKAKERTKRPRALGALYSDNDDDDENARPLPQTTPRKQDEYGCVDYQPLLPEGETPSSQETKRKRLITLYQTSPDIFEGEVKQLMNDTYPTQRGVINDCSRGSGLTQSVFQKWPFLNNDKVLVAHAQQLLGIEVNEIWRRNLRKVTKIRNFFKYEYVTKIFIAKKKGIELPDPFVKNTIKEEKRQSQNDTRSELSLTLVIFPLIVYYFEEDRDFLFIIVENTLTIEEIIGKVPNAAPTLIIRGTSLYDETASCSVLLEKAFEIKVGNILDGFLLTFLCYFIFGCKYPKELQCTLEFIQRFIILINPPEGSKRKCKKRKQTSYNPKVLKLINILNEALSAITL